MSDEWQLLDTVPKDGTQVLFFIPLWLDPDPFEHAYIVSGDYDSVLDCYQADNGDLIEPTHWRSKPKPPQDIKP